MRSILDDEGNGRGRLIICAGPERGKAHRLPVRCGVFSPKKFWQRAMPTICWLLFHETLMVGYLKFVLPWTVIE
ncbi:hypothetical protein DMW99_29365 [Pseudomonas chlororaphis]|nr:hypothetical protein C1Y36_20495 [Pseudomonas sp. FW306-2-2C-D06C]PYC30471.1 hypothetical protein DMW99_29365 [Pseudomonas chlororaphis]